MPKSHRRVDERAAGGVIDGPVYGGANLGAGAHASGPAVIEEPTTIMRLPRWSATVTTGWNSTAPKRTAAASDACLNARRKAPDMSGAFLLRG